MLLARSGRKKKWRVPTRRKSFTSTQTRKPVFILSFIQVFYNEARKLYKNVYKKGKFWKV